MSSNSPNPIGIGGEGRGGKEGDGVENERRKNASVQAVEATRELPVTEKDGGGMLLSKTEHRYCSVALRLLCAALMLLWCCFGAAALMLCCCCAVVQCGCASVLLRWKIDCDGNFEVPFRGRPFSIAVTLFKFIM